MSIKYHWRFCTPRSCTLLHHKIFFLKFYPKQSQIKTTDYVKDPHTVIFTDHMGCEKNQFGFRSDRKRIQQVFWLHQRFRLSQIFPDCHEIKHHVPKSRNTIDLSRIKVFSSTFKENPTFLFPPLQVLPPLNILHDSGCFY